MCRCRLKCWWSIRRGIPMPVWWLLVPSHLALVLLLLINWQHRVSSGASQRKCRQEEQSRCLDLELISSKKCRLCCLIDSWVSSWFLTTECGTTTSWGLISTRIWNMGWWSILLATSTTSCSDRLTSLVSWEPQKEEKRHQCRMMKSKEKIYLDELLIIIKILSLEQRMQTVDTTVTALHIFIFFFLWKLTDREVFTEVVSSLSLRLSHRNVVLAHLISFSVQFSILRVGSPTWPDFFIRLGSHLPHQVFHFLDQLLRRFLRYLLGKPSVLLDRGDLSDLAESIWVNLRDVQSVAVWNLIKG